MDEVVRDEKGHFTKAMNQFMERGAYSRDVSITPKNRKNLDDRWSVDNGEITIKSRFSVIMATMMSPEMISRTMIGAGFVDRMIVLWIDSTPEEREKYFENPTPLYEDLGFNPSSTVEILSSDYQRIFDFWRKYDPEKEARRLGDLIRCFAVLGHHDETAYKELIVLAPVGAMRVAEHAQRVGGRDAVALSHQLRGFLFGRILLEIGHRIEDATDDFILATVLGTEEYVVELAIDGEVPLKHRVRRDVHAAFLG